jgi:hypothetical protein
MGVQFKDQRQTKTTVRPVSTELPLRIEREGDKNTKA